MKERVLTAVVLLLVVIGALFFDPTGWAVKVLIVLVAGVCGIELGKLTKAPFINFVPGLLVGYMVFAWGSQPDPILPLIFALLAIPFIILSIMKSWSYFGFVSGTVWVCASFSCFYQLASSKSPSIWPLLMTAAIPIWCGDTAAIFVGKAFGKHKLAPKISPGKTWEGLIGGIVAAAGFAALATFWFFPELPYQLSIPLGIAMAVVGVLGDLAESAMKRGSNTKDAASILPGHGGLLDRMDSLLFNAPILYYFARFYF